MRKTIGKRYCMILAALSLILTLAGCVRTPAESSSAPADSEQAVSASVSAASEEAVFSASSTHESSAVSAAGASSDSVSSADPAASASESDSAVTESADNVSGPVVSESDPASGARDFITFAVTKINKHGNVILDTTFDEMNQKGIEIGDIITVKAGNGVYDIPVGTSYTDVDSGEMFCRFDTEDQEVGLVINMGSFAAETGIARKQKIEEDPGYSWEILIPEIQLSLKEKQGYLSEYNTRNLTRTNVREDYPDLTDEEFANFRAVSVTGIRENYFYRSSSPINPALGRDTYAMAAMENAGISSVLNIADSVEAMKNFEAYKDSYYSRCSVINTEMSYDFASKVFGEKVKESAVFILDHDGPFLIHCKEGKDRTGILCAILECFAGASFEEIEQDYMLTFRYFYGVTPEQETYEIILKDNLVKALCGMFDIGQLDGADLQAESREYLRGVGLTDEQLEQLAEKLGE